MLRRNCMPGVWNHWADPQNPRKYNKNKSLWCWPNFEISSEYYGANGSFCGPEEVYVCTLGNCWSASWFSVTVFDRIRCEENNRSFLMALSTTVNKIQTFRKLFASACKRQISLSAWFSFVVLIYESAWRNSGSLSSDNNRVFSWSLRIHWLRGPILGTGGFSPGSKAARAWNWPLAII